MKKALYYFCYDLSKDRVAGRIYDNTDISKLVAGIRNGKIIWSDKKITKLDEINN